MTREQPARVAARLAPLGAVVVAASAALSMGCRGSGARPGPAPLASALPSAPSGPLPSDHLLWGELAEGPERVLGLALPRGFLVTKRFDGEVVARGSASPERVANYVRRRIEAASVEVGPTRTIFQSARVKGGSGPLLRIDVTDASEGAEIVLRDLSPVPVPSGLTEEERWRRAGLKPNGDLLDPTKAF